MKQLASVLALLGILVIACNFTGSATPAAATDTPKKTKAAAAATFTPTPTGTEQVTFLLSKTPTPTEEAVAAVNVVCNNVSLFLDPLLGSGFDCETVQESVGEIIWDTYPQYTKITFQGYPLAGRFFEPYLSVYPLPRYEELAPDVVPGSAAALETLIDGGAPPEANLPQVGLYGAAQEFHAQYQVVAFENGSGIRYLTQYAQYAAPINNHDMFYTFQGMTADGQYWISAILPMSHPLLPADPSILPEGATVDNFGDLFAGYIASLTGRLNDQAPASFVPSLTALDGLIASIQIGP
jgi:hypothetical protein